MITTAYNTWQELLEIMTKERPTQFAVVFDKDEQEWQCCYSLHQGKGSGAFLVFGMR